MKFLFIAIASIVLGSVTSVKYLGAGINLSGMEFSVGTDGNFHPKGYTPFDSKQIDDFISKKMSIIRIPFGWQFLTPQIGGDFEQDYANQYFGYVDKSLAAGAYTIIDLHNYARWNGKIVGQSEISDDSLVSLWKKIAQKYNDKPKIIFGLMNEPHDLDLNRWKQTVQTVVNAIREIGAKQMILIPGDDWTHAESFPRWYSVMKDVKNPDGSFENLILELHAYLDDGSGTQSSCKQNTVDQLQKVQQILKQDNRQAMLTETGGGSDQNCATMLKQQLGYLTSQPEQFIGFTIWAAGSITNGVNLNLDNPAGLSLFNEAVKLFDTIEVKKPDADKTSEAPKSSSAPASSSNSISSSSTISPSKVSSSTTANSAVNANSKATSKVAPLSPSTMANTMSSSAKPSKSTSPAESSSPAQSSATTDSPVVPKGNSSLVKVDANLNAIKSSSTVVITNTVYVCPAATQAIVTITSTLFQCAASPVVPEVKNYHEEDCVYESIIGVDKLLYCNNKSVNPAQLFLVPAPAPAPAPAPVPVPVI